MNKELMFSSATDLWSTPQDMFDKLNAIYRFDIDVCALAENAKCATYYTPETNGLRQDWKGICWMNPPYGRKIGMWILKARNSAVEFGSTIVCLLPARTDTKWFHDYCLPDGQIEFLRGRIKFQGHKNAAPFPSMIVVFKPRIT